jgi:hypothetical protein
VSFAIARGGQGLAIDVKQPDGAPLFHDEQAIWDAFRQGARAALLRHKALGESIVIWRDGRVVEVPPDQIDAELERAEREAARRRTS